MKKNNKTIRKTYPAALTIGESDSSSSSGIQADLRTFNAFGVYGCSVITALSNPSNSNNFEAISNQSITNQLDNVLSNIDVKSLKLGVLPSIEAVKTVAQYIKKYNLPVIYNPEIVSSSGELLLPNEVIKSIKNNIFPIVEWLILKIQDAEFLLGKKIPTENLVDASLELAKKYRKSILLKTKTLDDEKSCDIICRKGRVYRIEFMNTKIPLVVTRGMESTLASSMAAGLALGVSWKQMLCESQAFVIGSLKENVLIGNKLNAMYPPARWDSRQVRLVSEAKVAFNDAFIKNNKNSL
jgi:hydroxymethylpyrimidine/phosphomethylpyrimidine kinase